MSSSEKLNFALVKWGTVLSVTGALTVIFSGYGYQWGWWHFSFGFSLIPWGTGGAIVGGLIATIGLFRMSEKTKNYVIAGALGIVLAVAALGNIAYWYNEVQQGYPPIHDISTDLEDPPEFNAIAPLRADAPNPVKYAGEETAEIQRSFYPDLESVTVGFEYNEAYNRALEAARDMPWEIVDENREQGRIEAFEKLAWFGFIDDVVIRVDTTSDGAGTKIDIRSKSRIGRGDLGVNAKRIRSYIKELEN